jgi:hypothetical protein
VRPIFNYHPSLRRTIQLKKEDLAHDVTASTCNWIPEPCLGDSGGYRHDRRQPQSRHYHALVPIPRPERLGGGGEGCNSCDGICHCPASGENVQITQRLVGGYYQNNRTGMNFKLWVIHKSKGLSEAVMLRINQYLGFMPLRSTHDSPFFRELVDRRSIAQD